MVLTLNIVFLAQNRFLFFVTILVSVYFVRFGGDAMVIDKYVMEENFCVF